MMYRLSIAFCAVASAAIVACGDSLVLNNGDVLSGRLIGIRGETVIFDAALAGRSIVPTSEVKTLSTSETWRFTLKNGSIYQGTLMPRDGATVLLENGKSKFEPFELSEIVNAMPIAMGQNNAEQDIATEKSWDVQAETGIRWRTGDKDTSEPFARLRLRHESEAGTFTGSLLTEYADSNDFPQYYELNAEWQGAADTGNVYPELGLNIERDTPSGIDYRANLSGGAGITWFENETASFSGFSGLDLDAEKFDLNNALGTDEQEHDEDVNLRLTLRARTRLFKKVEVTSRLDLFPSLTDFGQWRARSESAVQFPISTKLRINLDLRMDYDNDPAFQQLDNWRTSVGASVLVDF